jgi:hypothetical protein
MFCWETLHELSEMTPFFLSFFFVLNLIIVRLGLGVDADFIPKLYE